MLKTILKELRPKHYIKNILVFLPVFFSLNLKNTAALLSNIYTFISFCAASSFVYIINDIIDCEKDKLHPVKKNRPIASGKISVQLGGCISIVCLLFSAALGLVSSPYSFACILLYTILNLLYSIKLKVFPIIDVVCIAGGFILRVVAGGFATGVPVSNWLILTVMTASFYLGFGKRRNEIRNLDGANTRDVLASYNSAFLDKAMNSMMTLAITFYALWSIDSDVTANLGTDRLVWTVPLVVTALLRYSLVIENDSEGDPVPVIMGDKIILTTIVLYAVLAVILVY